MAEQKWLDGYSGQSVDQLIALAADHRIDSIVLAFESALMQRADPEDLSALNEAELTILAVESMEREVNNGGYHQFFLNTPEYAPHLVAALQRIGCPKAAAISAKAIALHNDAQGKPSETLHEQCDSAYYENDEAIADQLFAYIRATRRSIRVGKPGP